MKILISVLCFMVLFVNFSYALKTYYLIDINNNIRYKQSGPATAENLTKDGLIQIESDDDISFDEVEYRGGKIVRRTKTTSELAKEVSDKAKKDKKVVDKGTARTKLIALGLTASEADAILE